MSSSGIISIIVVVVILVLFIILISYIKAPPQIAFIISGLSKQPRTYIGKGGIRIPFFERLDKVFLGQVTVDVKTSRSVPTNDFINVRVDAVTKLRVIPSPEGIRLAAKNFINMDDKKMAEQVQDSLEGNQKKAEAFEKYGKAAITDMVVKVLPDMARATAEPIKAIDNLSIYASDGNGVTNVTNSVPMVLKQTFDVVKDATGVDMSEIIKNNQRIKIDDDSQVTVKK